MALTTLAAVLAEARQKNYAVPAFNFWTYEDVVGILTAAQEKRSPVILMASPSCVTHLGLAIIAQMVRERAKLVDIPVVLHLDHAEDLNLLVQAMHNGFTSIMYDGSKLPIDENIANTQYTVRVARALGVSVEAEIGKMGKGEEGEAGIQILTDPDEAVRFCAETGVDALAIAAGTMHAMQTQQANIRFDIVEEISRRVNTPLVLHGSSGVRNEDLPLLSKTGICKINFGTKLRSTFVESCRNSLTNDPSLKNHVVLLDKAGKAVGEIVKDKISRLGSENRA